MLRVKTKIQTSPKHGIGLFADEFIPVGTITWQYDPQLDTAYSQEIINTLPECSKEKFMGWLYYDYNLKKYILCADEQRYINHSSSGVNINSKPEVDIAARDIHPGEELFCNYEDYEKGWFERREIDQNKFI